jgi:hypothetical protein
MKKNIFNSLFIICFSGEWSNGPEKAKEIRENPLNPTTLLIDMDYYSPSVRYKIKINSNFNTPQIR